MSWSIHSSGKKGDVLTAMTSNINMLDGHDEPVRTSLKLAVDAVLTPFSAADEVLLECHGHLHESAGNITVTAKTVRRAELPNRKDIA